MAIDINKLRERLDQSVNDPLLAFQPTLPQREAKAAFWTNVQESGISLPPSVNLATALKFASHAGIPEWWNLPGFQKWFLNGEEFRQKAALLADISLDELREIITSKNTPETARISAIKLALEVSEKIGSRSRSEKDKYLDEKIGEMNRAQLEDFIRSRTKLLSSNSSQELLVDTTADSK